MNAIKTYSLAAACLLISGVVARANPPSLEACKSAAAYSEQTRGQAMVVMYDGKIIFEQYADGGGPTKPQMLASGSKSLVGLAAMAAVDDGLIALDDPASKYITEWRSDPVKKQITLRELLTLTSGLTAAERGAAVHAPAWKAIAAKPMTGMPGQQFDYGAYHINTFAYALEIALHGETFEAYLKRRILDPIKVKVDWRFFCDDHHPQVGGGAFMTARDWARLGQMVCNGGSLDGHIVLKPESLAQCFVGTKLNPAYGLTWWLKKPVDASIVQKIPLLARGWGKVANASSLPDDLVAACGAGKQRLYVIPSLKLVIARQGALSLSFDDLVFLHRLLDGH